VAQPVGQNGLVSDALPPVDPGRDAEEGDGSESVEVPAAGASAGAATPTVVTGTASIDVGAAEVQASGVVDPGEPGLGIAHAAARGNVTFSGGQPPLPPVGGAPLSLSGSVAAVSGFEGQLAVSGEPPTPRPEELRVLPGQQRGSSTLASGSGHLNRSGRAEGVAVVAAFSWESVARGEVQMRLEQVVTLMDRSELLSVLTADDQLFARAIRAFFAELTRAVDSPPEEIVAPHAGWLARKIDLFTDSAAKARGAAAVTGLSGVAAAYLPQLHQLLVQLAGGL
jgi:hypothetical protein